MEVDGIGHWKAVFLYKQVDFHFHVNESESMSPNHTGMTCFSEKLLSSVKL